MLRWEKFMAILGTTKGRNVIMFRCVSVKKFAVALMVLLFGLSTGASAFAQDVSEHLDLAYYDGEGFSNEKHRLDLVIPQGRPVLATMLWIHGGAWAFG